MEKLRTDIDDHEMQQFAMLSNTEHLDGDVSYASIPPSLIGECPNGQASVDRRNNRHSVQIKNKSRSSLVCSLWDFYA